MNQFNNTLLDQYLHLEKKKEVIINHHPKLPIASIKYTATISDWSNPLILSARGLVIDDNSNIIAKPYDKFFNVNQFDYMVINENSTQDSINFYNSLKERNKLLPKEFIKQKSIYQGDDQLELVMNKLDGSLMIVATYNNQLMAFSSGSTYSIFTELLNKALFNSLSKQQIEDLTEFCKNYTLIFEHINTKTDPHIVSYDFTGFVLHGIIETKTGIELPFKTVQFYADKFNLRVVNTLPYTTFEEIQYNVENTKNHEGYVLVFKDGTKMKLKSSKYLEAHHTLDIFYTNCFSHKVISMLIQAVIEKEEDDLITFSSDIIKQGIVVIKEKYNYVIKFNEKFSKIVLNLNRYLKDSQQMYEYLTSVTNDFENIDKICKQQYFNNIIKLKRINNLNETTLNEVLTNKESIAEILNTYFYSNDVVLKEIDSIN